MQVIIFFELLKFVKLVINLTVSLNFSEMGKNLKNHAPLVQVPNKSTMHPYGRLKSSFRSCHTEKFILFFFLLKNKHDKGTNTILLIKRE